MYSYIWAYVWIAIMYNVENSMMKLAKNWTGGWGGRKLREHNGGEFDQSTLYACMETLVQLTYANKNKYCYKKIWHSNSQLIIKHKTFLSINDLTST
jgi:hypothetical protein